MRKFLIFLFSLSFLYAEEFPLERFHVYTVASNWDPHLDQLMESCKKHQIELIVLGMGKPYRKNGMKLIYMRELLKTLEDDEIVLFVDAFDVLVVADKEKILQKFLAMDKPFVMGAEKNCAPYEGLAQRFHGPTPFRYLNTGTYMGYVKNIKAWIEALQPISFLCDQAQAMMHYVRNKQNKEFYYLDTYCELFLPLFMVEESEVAIDENSREVICLTTNSKPCVIHANGRSFSIWNKIYDRLIAK